MNIWDAYCNPAYYNIYFDTLTAKGMSREKSEKLKYQYCNYLLRIKQTRFGKELRSCASKEEFLGLIKEIFEDYWKDKIKYEEMPARFISYLTFLDSIQALHNDYISEAEKQRLIDPDPVIPIERLTTYETDYLVNGKLVALMSPQLLSILKDFIEDEKTPPHKASVICQTYYGDLLPNMGVKDYTALIRYLWDSSHKVKKGGKHNMLKITFPNTEEATCTTLEGLKRIISFYGIEEVMKQKCFIRDEPLIVKYVQMGKESVYDSIDGTYYINILGNTKDRMNIIRRINMHFGNKLKVELV